MTAIPSRAEYRRVLAVYRRALWFVDTDQNPEGHLLREMARYPEDFAQEAGVSPAVLRAVVRLVAPGFVEPRPVG